MLSPEKILLKSEKNGTKNARFKDTAPHFNSLRHFGGPFDDKGESLKTLVAAAAAVVP